MNSEQRLQYWQLEKSNQQIENSFAKKQIIHARPSVLMKEETLCKKRESHGKNTNQFGRIVWSQRTLLHATLSDVQDGELTPKKTSKMHDRVLKI